MKSLHAVLASILTASAIALTPLPADAHGPGMGPGIGFFSKAIHDRLQLSPDQEARWQAIQAEAKNLRVQRRQGFQQLRQLLHTELAHPEPDLARVAQFKDQMEDRNLQAARALQSKMLDLYATMNPGQKAIVKEVIQTRLAKMHQRMQEMRKLMREKRG